MRSSRLPLLLLAIGIGAASLTVGCNPATKRRWLTAFFDGVPPEHPATNATAAGVSSPTNELAAGQPAPPVTAPAEQNYYGHPPFSQEKCSSCHASQFGQELKKRTPELCWDCHKDFLADMKVKHQPVESGDCKSCHDPHQASNNKLLVKTGQALCLDCHDAPVAKGQSKHQPVENGECLSCHNPHASGQKGLLVKADGKLCFGCHDVFDKQLLAAKVKHQPVENGECASCHKPHESENKKLLLKPDGKLCFDCHDNLQQKIAKAPFKHDPAGNGECASCHNAHQSNEPGLLVKERRQLCFECHEQKDLAAVNGHAGSLEKPCLECHDPHAGQDKYLLKPGTKPSPK